MIILQKLIHYNYIYIKKELIMLSLLLLTFFEKKLKKIRTNK